MRDLWDWWMLLLKSWLDGLLDRLDPSGGWEVCPRCDGKGYIDLRTSEFDLDVPMKMVRCAQCDGNGEHYVPSHVEMG
jgi:hypothetical protein